MCRVEVREVGRFEDRWDRLTGPVSAWVRNRQNWRRRRRMRAQTAEWKALARNLDEFDLDQLDADLRRMAILVDGFGFSRVRDLGFGMGEALIVATQRDPTRLRPLIASACEYNDDELRGTQRSGRTVVAAVHARNEMINAARDVVARTPKTDPPDIAPT